MFINIGYENFIRRDLVAVILKPDSSHVKKLRQDAMDKGILINGGAGHKIRSVIVLKTGQVVLSALQTTTFKARTKVNKSKQPVQEEDRPF